MPDDTARPAARILFIDDDEGLRELVRRALGRRGYEIVGAGGGLEGLSRLDDGPSFDLVAVDHYMPGLDGLETLERIRERPDAPPVVYVTGSDESRVAVAALKAGAADYVVKALGDDFFDLLASSFRQVLDRAALVRARDEAEALLRVSHERLEALLKEANHRVANSLAIVSAFVRMQAGETDNAETRAALRDTQQRIGAIIQVHRRLYRSDDIGTVDMADYLEALAAELEATWSTPTSVRAIRVDCAPFRLATDRAVSVGVIVAELVGNACKYAYGPEEAGEVRIRAETDGTRFRLTVEDDGGGPAAAAGRGGGTGMGSKLIRAMAHALGTEPQVESERGYKVMLDAVL
jgi:two-component sensor histidine kinase